MTVKDSDSSVLIAQNFSRDHRFQVIIHPVAIRGHPPPIYKACRGRPSPPKRASGLSSRTTSACLPICAGTLSPPGPMFYYDDLYGETYYRIKYNTTLATCGQFSTSSVGAPSSSNSARGVFVSLYWADTHIERWRGWALPMKFRKLQKWAKRSPVPTHEPPKSNETLMAT